MLVAEVPLEIPQLIDDRLRVTLYAADPDIVTPVGAAVDARGRLFVLESHTHLAPTNYSGPKRDRIKIFEGTGIDGRAARISVFADDVLEGMNLAFAPDGTLYVCAAQEVFALPDANDDGRADDHRTLLRLETTQTYPHNQLLGLTITADGWLYASRGNTGGFVYAWVGADGTRIPGYGEGGDIVRCRLDGSGLERVATGFWNPFDLKFDRFGRLLCVDNDPDSRGPNRLLHIVPGGDYGFRALYGGSGLHPYQAWEGDLPGTLPYIAGVGESPSAVLDLSFTGLPAEYRDTLLATVWGEHNVTLYRTQPAGVSLRGNAEPFLRGGRYFRPVALAPSPDGSLFLTDWVLSDYPNHGRGRIWKICAKPGVATMPPRSAFAAPDPDPAFVRFTRLHAAKQSENFPDLRAALTDEDPFVRSAAIEALTRPVFRAAITRELDNADARLRLGAILALRRAGVPDPTSILKARLADSDPLVRQMALMWTGEKVLSALRSEVEASAGLPGLTPRLFETWLATTTILESDVAKLYAEGTPGMRIKRPVPPALIERIVHDDQRPTALRALALPRLTDLTDEKNNALLVRFATTTEPTLQIEALRQLSTSAHADTPALLRRLALDRVQDAQVRAEALQSLGARADARLASLLDDPDETVRTQAARSLRFASGDAALQQKVAARLGAAARPESLEDWQKLLATGGDVSAGRRVFFSPVAACVNCHRLDTRGAMIGPDLSVVGRTANRAQLVHSIVKPSDDIAPQFQGWEVKKKDGETITGLQGHLRTGGAVSIISLDGREILIPGKDVAEFGALPASLMPEGLHTLLSVEEFRDLVAYLESLK
jgi:putative membrane-bound dehydrogenase-like protein